MKESSKKTYLVVYIWFVVNRVAFYAPLLEHPLSSPAEARKDHPSVSEWWYTSWRG